MSCMLCLHGRAPCRADLIGARTSLVLARSHDYCSEDASAVCASRSAGTLPGSEEGSNTTGDYETRAILGSHEVLAPAVRQAERACSL